MNLISTKSCLVQVGNCIELEGSGSSWSPVRTYQWLPCGVTWDLSRTVVVIKLPRTSALNFHKEIRHFGLKGDRLSLMNKDQCRT